MKAKTIHYLGAILMIALSSGCDFKSHMTTTTSIVAGRDYTYSVSNASGSLNVAIVTTYLGKSPTEPVTTEISRNWKTQDTDFYNYRIENRSTNSIELTSITFALEEVRGGTVYETRDRDSIEKEFGVTIIAPRATVIRSNSWVWGKNNEERTLVKTYHGTCAGRAIELPVKLFYRLGK